MTRPISFMLAIIAALCFALILAKAFKLENPIPQLARLKVEQQQEERIKKAQAEATGVSERDRKLAASEIKTTDPEDYLERAEARVKTIDYRGAIDDYGHAIGYYGRHCKPKMEAWLVSIKSRIRRTYSGEMAYKEARDLVTQAQSLATKAGDPARAMRDLGDARDLISRELMEDPKILTKEEIEDRILEEKAYLEAMEALERMVLADVKRKLAETKFKKIMEGVEE